MRHHRQLRRVLLAKNVDAVWGTSYGTVGSLGEFAGQFADGHRFCRDPRPRCAAIYLQI